MPASLADFARKTKTITITIPDSDATLTVEYKRWSFTAKSAKATQKAFKADDFGTDYRPRWMVEHVVAWDLLDDNPDPGKRKPIPLTLEGLQDVDYAILSWIIEKVTEDYHPNLLSGSASANGS